MRIYHLAAGTHYMIFFFFLVAEREREREEGMEEKRKKKKNGRQVIFKTMLIILNNYSMNATLNTAWHWMKQYRTFGGGGGGDKLFWPSLTSIDDDSAFHFLLVANEIPKCFRSWWRREDRQRLLERLSCFGCFSFLCCCSCCCCCGCCFVQYEE